MARLFSAWWILLAVVLMAAAAMAGADKQPKGRNVKGGPKTPDVSVVEIKVQRDHKVLSVEGVIRNTSAKPLRGVVLYFVFLDADAHMITRKSTRVTGASLESGEESEFLGQTPDSTRAVQVRLEAEDKDGRFLTVDKPGPYDIE
jgi:hypothetical protein